RAGHGAARRKHLDARRCARPAARLRGVSCALVRRRGTGGRDRARGDRTMVVAGAAQRAGRGGIAMAAIPVASDHLLAPAVEPTREVAWWGMGLLCATEAALFAYLLASYFYLAVQNPAWPPQGVDLPKLAKPIVMTVLLLSSSA